MRSKCDVSDSDGHRQPSSQKRIQVFDREAWLPRLHSNKMNTSRAGKQRSTEMKTPAIQYRDKSSYLSGLKLCDWKRIKMCLCKMPTKTHHQTHLHLPDCRSAVNVSALTAPASCTQSVPLLLHRHVQKGSLMIQASVREAIWARQCTHPCGRSR